MNCSWNRNINLHSINSNTSNTSSIDPKYLINSREEFGTLLKNLNLNGIGVEIGVLEGAFSEVILSTSNLKKLFLIDIWKHMEDYEDVNNVEQDKQEERYFKVLSKFENYGSRVSIIRADCNIAVKYMTDNYFDFIYIDANHSYKAVLNDIIKWYPKVRRGGILAGHDYVDGETSDFNFPGKVMMKCGVKSAVNEFVKKNNLQFHITEKTMRDWSSWYLMKP